MKKQSRHTQAPTPYLRLPEAASYVRAAERSVANEAWRARTGIPTLRIGRLVVFDRRALDRWLARLQEGR